MSGHHYREKRRIRIITDEAKYRRHLRKKALKRVGRWLAWGVAILGGLWLFWVTLDRMLDRMKDAAGNM
jgi:hypothetical protein